MKNFHVSNKEMAFAMKVTNIYKKKFSEPKLNVVLKIIFDC